MLFMQIVLRLGPRDPMDGNMSEATTNRMKITTTTSMALIPRRRFRCATVVSLEKPAPYKCILATTLADCKVAWRVGFGADKLARVEGAMVWSRNRVASRAFFPCGAIAAVSRSGLRPVRCRACAAQKRRR